MALTRFGPNDMQLGQRIAVGNGEAYVPSAVLADESGSAVQGMGAAPSTARLLSAGATTNATSVKASAGTLKGVYGYNAKASAVFLKFYNKASAPTVGTDTPVLTIRLAPTADFKFDLPSGAYFSTGIAFAITGAVADADTTALVAADVIAMNVLYT